MRLALVAANAVIAAVMWASIVVAGTHTDAFAYFAADLGNLYDQPANTAGAFQYSPAFALAIEPLRWLGWHGFLAVWTAFQIALLAALMGRYAFGLALLLPPVAWEVGQGNVHLLIAAIVLRPELWPVGLLTKVTPVIAVLAVRRLRSLVAVVAVVAVTELAVPGGWWAWGQWLIANASPVTLDRYVPVPLLVRLPLAVMLVLFARRGRQWLLAPALWLSLPTMWFQAAPILLGAVAVQRERERARVGVGALTPDHGQPSIGIERRLWHRIVGG